MPLRIRLVTFPISLSYFNNIGTLETWRIYHRFTMRKLFHIIEVFCCWMYLMNVLEPVQMDAYNIRGVFKSVFFLETHETSVATASFINNYYQEIQEKAESIKTDFLMDIDFPNETTLVYHHFTYNNGTESIIFEPSITSESLKNITTIRTSVPIYVFSSRRPVPGCSLWEFLVIVSCVNSDPAFFLSSKIIRHRCPLEGDSIKGRKIDRKHLHYYFKSIEAIRPLFISSLIHLFILFYEHRQRWAKHHHWLDTDVIYQELKPRQQFHYTFGVWLVYEIFVSCLIITACIVVFVECLKLTEYPSLLTLQYFAVSSFFMFLSALQWFQFNDYSYHFVEIIREGIFMIVDVILGFVPIIFAFFLFGIFMFSSVAEKAHSIVSMVEILVSFTLGDNIMPTYNAFSDGTPLFNWLAFFYITVFVLMAGWVVFASFTATISFVDHKIMMKKEHPKTE